MEIDVRPRVAPHAPLNPPTPPPPGDAAAAPARGGGGDGGDSQAQRARLLVDEGRGEGDCAV